MLGILLNIRVMEQKINIDQKIKTILVRNTNVYYN